MTTGVRASGVSSAPGLSAETAIKVEGADVPPRILRNFQTVVKRRVLIDPTIQCSGQNRKQNVLTFSIAKKPIVDGVTGARKILQDIMPTEQATSCMNSFRPKQGVSVSCFVLLVRMKTRPYKGLLCLCEVGRSHELRNEY
jgi:hypothetical protein